MEAERREQCERCGSQDVRSDQVLGEEFLGLGECMRCSFRWTRPLRGAVRRASERTPLPAQRGPETIAA